MTTLNRDRTAFLAAIKASPDDDTARLVYADFLDEHGKEADDHDRAELIRVHFQIDEVDAIEHTCLPNGGYESTCPACGAYCESERLHNRADELIDAHPEWTRWPCPECGGGHRASEYAGYHGGPCMACGNGDLLQRMAEIDYDMLEMKRIAVEWDRGFPGWVTLSTWNDAVTYPQLRACSWCEGTGRERIADAAGDMDDVDCRKCGGHGDVSKEYPTHRLKALAQLPPWGVPLRGVRIGEAKPDRNGAGWCWFDRDRIDQQTSFATPKSRIPSVIFRLLNHWDTNKNPDLRWRPYPTERAALDALAAAVLEFGRTA